MKQRLSWKARFNAVDEKLAELKEIVYKQAVNGSLPQSSTIETIKAYALLTIAENKQQ